jgi:hypothetical protein
MLKRNDFDEICNFTANINLFDERLILRQEKCRLPSSIQEINSAQKSVNKIALINSLMKAKNWLLIQARLLTTWLFTGCQMPKILARNVFFFFW